MMGRSTACLLVAVLVGTASLAEEPKPLIGSELLHARRVLRKEEEAAGKELRARQARLRELEAKSQKIKRGFLLQNAETLRSFLLWDIPGLVLWSLGILFMYRRLLGRGGKRYRKLLWRLFLIFGVLGALAFLSGVASAAEVPPDLKTTVNELQAYESMEPWQRTLRALSDRNATRVTVPDDVARLALAACPPLAALEQPLATRLKRTAYRAAILWAKGKRDEALVALDPFRKARLSRSEAAATYFAAVHLLAAGGDNEAATSLAGRISPRLNANGLVQLATILQKCCYEKASELLTTAQSRTRTAEQAVEVAAALRRLGLADKAHGFLADKVRLALSVKGMAAFLEYCRKEGLADIEQLVISANIDARNRRADLADLAERLRGLSYPAGAARALDKAVEKERVKEGLFSIALKALSWGYQATARRALERATGLFGFEAAIAPFKDPMLLPVSAEKPVDQDPSVGIVIAMIAERQGERDVASRYYRDALNLELSSAMTSGRYPDDINFASFFYAYRFALASGDHQTARLLDPVGRKIEKSLLSRLSHEHRDKLRQEVAETGREISKTRRKILVLRAKQVAAAAFLLLACAFVSFWLVVVLYAQIVIVRRMLKHAKMVDHLRSILGFTKLAELEGFFLLPAAGLILSRFAGLLASEGLWLALQRGLLLLQSAAYLFAAILILLAGQFLQSIVLNENHLFRLSEERRTGSMGNVPKVPMTYRDQPAD